MFPGTNLSRFIARAGFDWVCVDCEHGNMAGAGSSNYVLNTIQLCRAATSSKPALICPSSNNRRPNARIGRGDRLLRR